jgi:hypothetical protein
MSIVTLNDRAVRSVTAFGSLNTGSIVFIKKLTASSSSTLSFVDGSSDVVLDNTYKEYLFTFNNIHPATNRSDLTFNMSSDSGSNYNVTKTTTFFRSFNFENDSNRGLGYLTANDLAQGTGTQILSNYITNEDDSNASGYLHLFNPSSTTFIKHFMSSINHSGEDGSGYNYSYQSFTAGYGNTTSAIDAIQFSMSSGNIDAGDICLYGIL